MQYNGGVLIQFIVSSCEFILQNGEFFKNAIKTLQ